MNVLVVNCGSSSVKYRLYEMPRERLLARGNVEKIGLASSTHAYATDAGEWQREVQCPDHDRALQLMAAALMAPQGGVIASADEVCAVGHRVVHGGEAFRESAIIDDTVEATIESLCPLAPLHNPPNLKGIRAARRLFGRARHVAVFDTAFHETLPPHAYLYALPYRFYQEEHIRKYGFHGTSFRYIAQRAAQLMQRPLDQFNAILCHLGNGSSIAAVRGGKSVDTSMGLTPLEGLIMGTRCGDIDPGVLFHLLRRDGMSVEKLDQLLNKESGVLGISGVSNDMRLIEEAAAKGHARAQLALDCFHYRVRKYVGAYLAVLVRVDAIVFTAGIGERGPDTRAAILAGLEPFGIALDPQANATCRATEARISTPDSRIQVWVIPTNEELMIARDTYQLASGA